ncbi:LPS export ABC transporter permease LptF [Litorilituus sediminis]|uniref:Lipopolysaccharide export system permease protein LptF n=1 Tax=Litorilituus sediminis TaxID=718192 RepID=A0A4V0ZFZ9_9GAMM|nr:LPS export ABC transporter permease LptF [Litorilituus sediminis]QBG35560.1 LPS export ABC transporter permease LptF [Litorilituus sediminis]
MIIFRYLLKEVAKTQLAVFFVLMTIFISQKFVRVLGDASEGSIPGQMVMTFIALKVPDLAGMMLPLSLFLGVLLAYGRIYADSEMTVLHACGVSEWYVVRVTLVLAFITAIFTGIFTLYLAPMASEYQYRVKEELAADSGLSALVAGRFQQTGNKDAVVFIHDKSRKDNSFNKVFVAQLPDENSVGDSIINSSLVYAHNGQVFEDESGSQRLVLGDGIRYHSDAENGEFQSVAFDKYYIEIKDQAVEHQYRKLSALPTSKLFEEVEPELFAQYRATIQWRVAFPLACIILTFIAVPLSVVNPRQGKFAKMLPALMLFLGYFLLLTAMRSGVEKQAIPSYIGMWPVHISALFMGVTLLMRERTSGRKIKAKLPKLRRNKAHANQGKAS